MSHLLNEPAKKMFKFLGRIHPMSEGLREDLLEAITYLSVPKSEILLEPGEVCKNLYFVHKGLLRSFNLVENENTKGYIESTFSFMRENQLCMSIPSYCSQTPSHEYIEALEPSELICVSHENVERLFLQHKEFNTAGLALTGKTLAEMARKARAIRTLEADERIEVLRKRDPALVKRVPEKYLRTYLVSAS